MLPRFTNPNLLMTALTHRSALNEQHNCSQESNERLEFLGDAVLELASTRFLFDKLPEEQEGILTAYRSALVKTTTLAEVAKNLGLGEKVFLSKGEEATGGRTNPSLLADVTEAVIGAIYLDQGFEAAETFLHQHLFVLFDTIKQQRLYKDAKSELQEVVQSRGLATPIYRVLSAEGPDHDKHFVIAVIIDGQQRGRGEGRSKQLAQQAAAQQALNAYR